MNDVRDMNNAIKKTVHFSFLQNISRLRHHQTTLNVWFKSGILCSFVVVKYGELKCKLVGNRK